jgi:hypothetical protein
MLNIIMAAASGAIIAGEVIWCAIVAHRPAPVTTEDPR